MAVFESNAPSLANRYASSLGQGLEQLAQHKLQQMQQEKQRQQIEGGLAGIFGPGARQLSQLYSQPKLLQALVSGGIERGVQTPEGEQRSLPELFGQPYTAPSTLQQQQTQQGIQQRHQENLGFRQQQESEKARRHEEGLALRKEQLGLSQQTAKERLETQKTAASEKAEIAKQGKIDTGNKKYLENLSKGEDLARQVVSLADQMQALIDTGNVYSGVRGKVTPRIAQNTETQQFEALGNDLASLLASNSGVATNFKIKFAQERKPNLTQKTDTQRALIQKVRDEAQNVLSRGEARDLLIQGNQGKQPENIESLINKSLKQFKKVSAKKEIPKNLPSAKNLPDGKTAKNRETGEVEFVTKNGQWEAV